MDCTVYLLHILCMCVCVCVCKLLVFNNKKHIAQRKTQKL